jgi:acyl-coenzyme A synthetase/AMP-(fatty) acid ligase
MSDDPRLPDTVQSLPEAIAIWAERMPDAAAIVVPGSPAMSYAQLWLRVSALAAFLNNAGVGREDRIVLLLPEGVALTEALLGALFAGVAAPLPASLTAAELDEALHGLRASAALVAPGIAPAVRASFARHAVSVLELGETTAVDASARAPLPWPRAEELAIVRQTSGTTGRPKRIPCLHGALVDNGRRQRDQFGVGAGDRAPAVSALTVTLGQTVLAHTIVAGGALIVPPSGDIGASWHAIARERPAWMSTSAGYLELLARSFRQLPPRSTHPSLRFVQATSAPIAPETCRALERQLGAPILPRYSSTEAGAIAMTLPPPAKAKPGSVGQPVQEVRIVGPDEEDVAPGRREKSGCAGRGSCPATWTMARPRPSHCSPAAGTARAMSATSMRMNSCSSPAAATN